MGQETTELEQTEVTTSEGQPAPEPEEVKEPITEPETPEEVTEPEPEDEPKTGFDRKVKKLTQKAREAEQAAQYWYQEALKHQGKVPVQPEPETPEPKFSDYNDIDAFGRAIGKYQAELAVKAALAQRSQEEASTGLIRSYNQRLAEFKKETPDFDEVFEDLDVPLPEDLMQGILESEEGPAIAYYLATNQKEVHRLNKLSPHRRLIELGKIETKLMKL